MTFLFYLFLSYAKFGHLSGMPLGHSINPVQREFAVKHGLFRLERVPYSFGDYFILRRAVGLQALFSNTTGNNNTANGDVALFNNTAGSFNTATGDGALVNNGTGSFNIALGFQAGINHTTGSNNIYIGSLGTSSEHRTIRIGAPSTHGRTFVAGISGVTVAGGVGVIVDTNGQLGTVVSSERFKDEIKPMDKASEAILALKPVTFRYKQDLDPHRIPQFGLVAEDVEKVNPRSSGP